MHTVELQPVGVVRCAERSPAIISLEGISAMIEVAPEYMAALERITENSHLWVIAWFHEARRDVLATAPTRVNPDLPKYGVFGLRSPARPNPIALTLVTLDGVSGNCLYVRGLDAVDGTAVLDIKPYYEQDIVFSPRTPAITAANPQVRQAFMAKEALQHHGESCRDFHLGVRMGLLVEEQWGKLNNDQISLSVTGSACLADVLQGITRARLANPPRFAYHHSYRTMQSVWRYGDKQITLTVREGISESDLDSCADAALFHVEIQG
jgi:tRNA (adenine37-N6)-methyltransferase